MPETKLDLLQDSIGSLQKIKALCVGDVILDTFNIGTVARISPESPIPVFQSGQEMNVPGGAANVARNVAALGGQCYLVGVLGYDTAATILSEALATVPGISFLNVTEAARRTSHKVRYIAQGQHMLRVDNETSSPVLRETEDSLLETVVSAIDDVDVVILSDYAKGVLSDRVISRIIELSRSRDLPVVVDPKSTQFIRYAGATVLTPNLKETISAVGYPLSCDEAIVQAAHKLIQSANLTSLLVTRSEEGMTLVDATGSFSHIRTLAREVFDVVGAGDTVVATLAMALAAGLKMTDAAELSNIAAGIVVGKKGTATVSPEEVLDRIADLQAGRSRHGAPLLLNAEQAVRYAAMRRAEGKRIGFTNGVFDIVHPGHIALLEFSRSTCDTLIVGLNSDSSVRRLGKGPERPINTELDRAAVLGAFGTVDAVVIFEQDTPIDLIEAIRPDVLIKGADYTVDSVVGAETVKKYGGVVRLAPIVTGKSSTNIIKRMQLDGGHK